ncbi:MAG: HU family DNA-binding protein [Acinetobacter sp.]|nr:HU family DNA-binding protein [Acinetobacter sp.]
MSKSGKAVKKAAEKVVEKKVATKTESVSKAALVDSIAAKSSLTKKDAELALNAALDAISEALVAGKSVTLVGFGTFDVRDRAERRGFNPQTKEEITLPATRVAAFKAGKKLKEAVAK